MPSRLIAAANIQGSDGAELSGFGLSATARTGVGVYLLTLSAPPADVDVLPVVQLKSAALAIVLPVIAGVITVNLLLSTGGHFPVDSDFFIHVVDGT